MASLTTGSFASTAHAGGSLGRRKKSNRIVFGVKNQFDLPHSGCSHLEFPIVGNPVCAEQGQFVLIRSGQSIGGPPLPELARPNALELTLCSRCPVDNTPFICDSLPDAPSSALEDRMKTPEMLDMAIACRLIEVMLDRCKSDDAFETNVAAQDRKAVHKSLESSRMLMGVAHQLMVQPESLTPRDSAERLKALLEEIKTAARTAYQAGLLLTGRD